MAAAHWLARLITVALLVAWCSNAVAASRSNAVAASRSWAVAASRSWADFSDPVFHNIGIDQGLPNPAVNAIAQDADGFLWFGTQGGLVRWDGYNFRIYRPSANVAGSVPDAWITALHTDPRGNLWIGTSAGGLARYDPKADRFVHYGTGSHRLSGVNISAIADDGAGGLWIGTENGLDHLDPVTNRTTVIRRPAEPAASLADSLAGSLPDNHISALMRDRTGSLWIGTSAGLARLSPRGDRLIPVALRNPAQPGLTITSLFQGPDRRIWVGTMKSGAFVMAENGEGVRPVVAPGTNGRELAQDWVEAIGVGDNGDIWLGTYGHGIKVIDSTRGIARQIHHRADLSKSLANDTVLALYRDRSGAVWVGSMAGLDRLASVNGVVSNLFGGDAGRQVLSDTDVTAVLPARDGRLWLGQINKGVEILDPVRGRIAILAPNRDGNGHPLTDQRILALAEWRDGSVFIGTYHGIYRADRNGKAIRRIVIPGRAPDTPTTAFTIIRDRLWIGGNNDGLWSINPDDRAAKVIHVQPARLSDGRLYCLLPGLADDLWIGTAHGLNRMVLSSQAIERFLPERANPQSLSAGNIGSLLIDSAGRLWVGTSGGGINIMTGRQGNAAVFRRIGIAQGLPDGNVDAMLPDRAGRIWVTTDNGVAVIDARTFAVKALQPADGVAMSTYWAGSGAVTAQGELLFGGSGGGLAVIRPDRYRPWNYNPPIVIAEIRLGGVKLSTNLFAAAMGGEQLTVQPDANSLAVEFSALDFTAPRENRYAYRLIGFDKDWIETDATQRDATYTNLPPGTYTLQIRGTNREGAWSAATRSLTIRVLPAWYQTWWFDIAVAVIAIAVILGLIQARTHYLRRRQRDLELLVAQRTAELEERKREIEHIANSDSLTGLPNRRMFAEQCQHRLRAETRNGHHFALMLIDFDGFKQINDTLGHDAGDAFLLHAGQRLTAALRRSDSVCRMGGDEFAILIGDLPGSYMTDHEAIAAMCLRVSDSFIDPITIQGLPIRATVSIGVALCPKHGRSQETLYKAADVALYAAKRSGKNTWRIYDCITDKTPPLHEVLAPEPISPGA